MHVYKDKLQKVILPVKGMSCASCVHRVQTALNLVSGVICANANYATEKAMITFFPVQVDIKDLARAIESAGYSIPVIRKSSKAINKVHVNASL